MDQLQSFEAHNGDDEYVVLAWKIINNKKLELKYVYTSAHGDMSSGHSGVWNAKGETTVIGSISNWYLGTKFTDDPMTWNS